MDQDRGRCSSRIICCPACAAICFSNCSVSTARIEFERAAALTEKIRERELLLDPPWPARALLVPASRQPVDANGDIADERVRKVLDLTREIVADNAEHIAACIRIGDQ